MNPAVDLRLELLASTDIGVLVGERVYPLSDVPQTDPASPFPDQIWYQQIGRQDELLMNGAPALRAPRFQILAASGSYDKAHEIGDAIYDALAGFQGDLGGPGGTPVRALSLQDERDDFEPEMGIKFVVQEWTLQYE